MPLPKSITDREYQKFLETAAGEVAVRLSGSFSPTGLNNGGRITVVTLNDTTWTPLPLNPFVVDGIGRNTLAIQVPSTGSIYINFDQDRNPNAQAARYVDDAENPTLEFTADNAGILGNSISLSFNGIDNINTVVSNWNLANSSNTVTLSSGSGSEVLATQTINLTGGLDAVTVGWEVKSNGEFFFDVSQGIPIYALAEASTTPNVLIMEIS